MLVTVDALFPGLPKHAILRAELRRLFHWLKDRGMTAIITGEKRERNAISHCGGRRPIDRNRTNTPISKKLKN